MAFYIHQAFGQTIAPGATLRFLYSWQNSVPPVGPNHGPVFFTADPKSHQSAEVKLVTFDIAKCRNAPTGPGPNFPGTEVFYKYSVRSENTSITAAFDLEIIWGSFTPGPITTSQPW